MDEFINQQQSPAQRHQAGLDLNPKVLDEAEKEVLRVREYLKNVPASERDAEEQNIWDDLMEHQLRYAEPGHQMYQIEGYTDTTTPGMGKTYGVTPSTPSTTPPTSVTGERATGKKYSLRTKPAPTKTVVAYKVLRTVATKPGKLFPLYANRTQEVPIGVWLDAEMGKTAMAPRPGWHVTDLPRTSQIGKKGPGGVIDRQHAHTVWAEVEIAADVDWQAEADRRGKPKKDGTIDPKTKEIRDEVPVDGFYRYKTKTEMEGEWMISGAMKINRILEDSEVDQILRDHGVTPVPREGGPIDLRRRGLKYSLHPKRPLANPGLTRSAREEMDRRDFERALAGRPPRQSDVHVAQVAERRLAADYEGELRNLREKAMRGAPLDQYETVMGKSILTREHDEAVASGDPQRIADAIELMDGWRETGATEGRSLRQRFDPIESPAERANRIGRQAVLVVPKDDQKTKDELLDKAEAAIAVGDTAAAKAAMDKVRKINEQWAQQVLVIRDKLKHYGIDLDDLWHGHYTHRKAIHALRAIRHAKSQPMDRAFEYWSNAILAHRRRSSRIWRGRRMPCTH